jgi:glycosyltransferase involved in cell wall biosynthesis
MNARPISIVIPAYNEEKGIRSTLERLQAMKNRHGLEMEVIVIDDGSSDATGEAARAFGATVIRNPVNAGYGSSIRRGMKAAQFEYVAITDADGTYPVEEIPHLITMMDEGLDMAVGARQGSEYWKIWWKNPARVVFRGIAEFVAGRCIPDINSGLRIMRRSTILQYLSQTCLGFSFTTSVTLILMLNGYFVDYRPIVYTPRIGASKIRHFRDTLRTTQIMTSLIATHNPIKLAIIVDLSVFLLAVIFFFFAPAVAALSTMLASILVMVANAFFVSLPIVFMLGCIGELLRIKLNHHE